MTVIDARPSCFYYPLKVIFLDDNRAFLDALELEFSDKLNMQTLTSPDSAYRTFDVFCQDASQPIVKLINDANTDSSNERAMGFDVSKMLTILYDKARFDYAPLLIVDYQMPVINGIEFCKKLQKKNVFKIMLTAEADKDTVIEAFNKGLIDKFLLKTSNDLYSEVTLSVKELTQCYFKELTKYVINRYGNSINALFDNELYQQLFASVLIQSQAVEYYLIDNSGSILFLDKEAKPTWLIIRHINELSEQLDLLQGYERSEHVVSAVEKKEKLLFLLSDNEYKKPITEWINHLFDAEQLDSNYYYSVTQNYVTDSIDWNRVVSYSAYLEDR